MHNKIKMLFLLVTIVFTTSFIGGCNSTAAQPEEIPVELVDEINVPVQEPTVETSNPTANAGYPNALSSADEPSYPVPNPLLESASSELPNPEITLPAAKQDTGVVGGVLIWKLTESGFVPLEPKELSLAEVVLNSKNEISFVRASDESPKAQLFPTGIFIFDDVPPGKYGLVVDVGHTIFPVGSETEDVMIVEIVAGDILDLGQVITELPDS